MKPRQKRLTFVVIAGVLVASATGLILNAFEQNIVFFRSPGDIINGAADTANGNQRIRLGGLVLDNSLVQGENGRVRFAVTDTVDTVPVEYTGILPDLFREGQGVVAEGMMVDGVFRADTVLAKHDENYMPPEVSQAIKDAGQWQGDTGSGTGSGADSGNNSGEP